LMDSPLSAVRIFRCPKWVRQCEDPSKDETEFRTLPLFLIPACPIPMRASNPSPGNRIHKQVSVYWLSDPNPSCSFLHTCLFPTNQFFFLLFKASVESSLKCLDWPFRGLNDLCSIQWACFCLALPPDISSHIDGAFIILTSRPGFFRSRMPPRKDRSQSYEILPVCPKSPG